MENEEYRKHKRELDELERKKEAHQKQLKKYIATKNKMQEQQTSFNNLMSDYEAVQKDLDGLTKESVDFVIKLKDKLKQCIQSIDDCKAVGNIFSFLTSYAILRDDLLDNLEYRRPQTKSREEYKKLLSSIYAERRAVLLKFTNRQSPEKWRDKLNKSIREIEARINETQENIELLNLFIEEQNIWLSSHIGAAQNQSKEYRKELNRARYFLSRIESVIFENEVWNALTPLKEECGIQTIYTEQLENGRQRRCRILYKSDLLFYLKIYNKLHKKRSIPEYNLICIDEGQDLHCADYALIKALYPNAVLNVFGDKNQVLHDACGINDWNAETGIQKVYTLNSNYRNNAAIVDFCNKKFGSSMEYFGTVLRIRSNS